MPTDAAKAKNTSRDCLKSIQEISNQHAKPSSNVAGAGAGPAAAN